MIHLEREATYQRLETGTKRVLAVQDSTSFNFETRPKTRGLGVIEDNRTVGFFAHSTLAVSVTGVPLGLLDQQVWSRPPTAHKKDNAHQALPITEKESYKWLNGLDNSLKVGAEWELITVCDREADIYELFQDAHNRGAKFIVRAVRNRRLDEGGLLYEHLETVSVSSAFSVEVAARGGQAARQAQVELRYATVTLLPPKNRPSSAQVMPLEALKVQVLEVFERHVPEGCEAVHWILLTNLEVGSVAQAEEALRFYSYRWLVERFHYVLKSGCEFEESQLKSFEALSRLLALYSGVAWRLLWMTYQARKSPDAPCTLILSETEWQALGAYMQQSPYPPAETPGLAQAVRWIAQLGGFVGRKQDGEPGVKVLWRGWEVFQNILSAWVIFHPPSETPPLLLDVGKA